MLEVLKVSGFGVQGGLASAEAFCRDTKRVERMQSDLGRHRQVASVGFFPYLCGAILMPRKLEVCGRL